MLGGQPLPHRFLGCIIGHAKAFPVYLEEEGWHQLLHLTFAGYARLITQLLLLCPLVGFPKGYPPPIGPLVTSLHFLPRLCLPWVSQPIRAVPTQMPFCTCAMHLGRLLCPSFLFQLLKGKQLQFTEQLHTAHFIHHG